MEHTHAVMMESVAAGAPQTAPAAVASAAPTTRLRPSSRVVIAACAVAFLATFVAPLWRIGLKAPQYPEGLEMFIWSNKITGALESINRLNHYIGMREIHPEAIAELRLMPHVVIGLAVLGVLAALWGRRAGLFAWTGLVVAGSLVGLVDFWKWGYEYGHNLDPTAAIKIPGMSYQPPLIGNKVLLNFQATSWPALAGWLAIGAVTLAVVLSIREYRATRS
jgi:copper chaperone NosL